MRRQKHFTTDSRLLTTAEVADILHVGTAHMLRLARAGKIGSYKAGKQYLFDYDRHIVPYLRAGEIEAEASRD